MPSHCAAGLLRTLTVALVLSLVSGCLRSATKDTVDRQERLEPASAAQVKETVKDADAVASPAVIRDLAEAEPESSAWTFLERALDAKDVQAELLFLAAAKNTHIEPELPAVAHCIGNPGAALAGTDASRVAVHVDNARWWWQNRSPQRAGKENDAQQQQGRDPSKDDESNNHQWYGYIAPD